MWLFKIGGSCSKSIGTGISVGSGFGSKSGKDIGVNNDSKFETKSQNWRSNSYNVQVKFHWNKNLSFCQWFDIGQVQGGVMKLNFG